MGSRKTFTRRLAARAAVTAAGAAAAAACAVATPAAASAATLTINGGGSGHGIGMSQYGALGFALHHWTDRQILSHYYSDTTLEKTNPNRIVTVLLGQGRAGFSGASTAGGHRVDSGTTYTVSSHGSDLKVTDGSRTIGTFRAPLTVRGSGALDAKGYGRYDGSLVFRPVGGQVETIEAVGLDDYVAGVVAQEMPSSWPAAALEAQAIAVRTYAITSGDASPDYDLYSDTRSQSYGGIAAETPSTNAAVSATRGQVVEYQGEPAFTPYFASSGGHTESIQNVWIGSPPDPWLQGVPDPYDDSGGNPYYRWTVRMTTTEAAARLSGYVRGRFTGITITRRGVSKRIVNAEVDGTGGRVAISGSELEYLLGTLSTLMSFKVS